MGKRVIPREAFAQHEKRAARIRECLVDMLEEVPAKKIAIPLSSGVDSHAILFAALEAKKQPTIYSITLDDRESQDFRGARRTSEILGLPFVPVILPTKVSEIKRFISEEIYGPINPGIVITKATAECLWPVARLFDKVTEKAIVTGFNGDTWYCTLRSQKKVYDAEGNAGYQRIVRQYFDNFNGAKMNDPARMMQLGYLKRYKPGVKLYVPYNDPRMFQVMKGMDPIKEGWRPIQKAPVRLAFFDYFEKCRESVYIHSPMQKGDSGIEEHFHKLLDTDLNTQGYKSTIGIYNTFLRKWQAEYLRRRTPSIFEK